MLGCYFYFLQCLRNYWAMLITRFVRTASFSPVTSENLIFIAVLNLLYSLWHVSIINEWAQQLCFCTNLRGKKIVFLFYFSNKTHILLALNSQFTIFTNAFKFCLLFFYPVGEEKLTSFYNHWITTGPLKNQHYLDVYVLKESGGFRQLFYITVNLSLIHI